TAIPFRGIWCTKSVQSVYPSSLGADHIPVREERYMPGTRTRWSRQAEGEAPAIPTLDEFASKMDELLSEKLDPIRKETDNHHAAIENHKGIIDKQGDFIAKHEDRLEVLEQKYNLLSGDSLGGEPVRLLIALVALFIGMLVS